jgi:hypothetical protein
VLCTDPTKSRQVDPRCKSDDGFPSVNTTNKMTKVQVDGVYRWLTNEQAVEDSARFMAHVKFDGLSEDLTAPNTPWIYYGVRICATYTCSISYRWHRDLTLELELLTCEFYTQIWSLGQLLRVVSVLEFYLPTHSHHDTGFCSCYPCFR